MDRDERRSQMIEAYRHAFQAAEREARIREKLTTERLKGPMTRFAPEERDRLERALAVAGTTLDFAIGEFVDQQLDAIDTAIESARSRAGV